MHYYRFSSPTLHLSPLLFFFFNDPATTDIYTLSLHDALPICRGADVGAIRLQGPRAIGIAQQHFEHRIAKQLAHGRVVDRKSTRLNSSHGYISYAVFCLKKKKKK